MYRLNDRVCITRIQLVESMNEERVAHMVSLLGAEGAITGMADPRTPTDWPWAVAFADAEGGVYAEEVFRTKDLRLVKRA